MAAPDEAATATDSFDFVIIGAGTAGEAAANLARARGATVAVADSELFGGSCPYWACMPSKSLLHSADVHAAGGDYDWPKASDRRDYMISREGTAPPDDGSHVHALEKVGAVAIRGKGRITGQGTVVVTGEEGDRTLAARHIVIAVGSHPTMPHIDGLDTITPWTNREATTTRTLPDSLVIIGTGPTGVELAQVFARYGVRTTLVGPQDTINPKDHPRNSEVVAASLRDDGVDIRTGLRAERIEARAGSDGAHVVHLSDGSSVEGHEVLVAVGRSYPVEDIGLETIGLDGSDGPPPVGPDLRIADDVFLVGDPAGPEMSTHLAHYQGELAVRIALGEDVRPDYSAIPHAIYTDPEAAGVGLLLEDAKAAGYDVFEETQDLAKTAKGSANEATGHVTIVVDRGSRTVRGAFIAGPGAAEAIHEAVLAIKVQTSLAVLADTIHAFPTTARVLGTVFISALRRIEDDK